MSGKVLGFKKNSGAGTYGNEAWVIDKEQLVPVVGLAELKKRLDFLLDYSKQISDNKDLFLDKSLNSEDEEGFFEAIDYLPELIKDLLSWVESRSKGETRK